MQAALAEVTRSSHVTTESPILTEGPKSDGRIRILTEGRKSDGRARATMLKDIKILQDINRVMNQGND
jgi:hypothetical protein